MDLEMTGLDPLKNVIVEMATLVTDDDLNILAEGPDLVIGASPEQLAEMEDVVRHMHTVSGLLVQIATTTRTVEEAAAETLDFLRAHVPNTGAVPLCGNSIGVDRRFLQEHAPELDAWFHYRSIDVSTVKELCKRWRPDVYAGRPHKQTAHRAMDDVRESVAELAYYKSRFFAEAPAEGSGGQGAADAAPSAGAADAAGARSTDTAGAASTGAAGDADLATPDGPSG
jgi:oligoribonuclease